MPDPLRGDRRLRTLCEAVMNAPAQHATLAEWAAQSGASERTLARLFRDELGTGFQRWRQQVVLAHAGAWDAGESGSGHQWLRQR